MQQLREEIIDEVQPVLPRSSVPRAAVIGVAQLAVTSSSFETSKEVGDFTFSNKDSSGMESPSICDKLSNDQLQGERREVKKSNAIIVIILLAVMVAALFACGFWAKKKKSPMVGQQHQQYQEGEVFGGRAAASAVRRRSRIEELTPSSARR